MTGRLIKERRGSLGHSDPGVDHVMREAEMCLQAWDGMCQGTADSCQMLAEARKDSRGCWQPPEVRGQHLDFGVLTSRAKRKNISIV